jgi:hypothetical protein
MMGIPFSEGTKAPNNQSEKHVYMVLPLKASWKNCPRSYGSQEGSENYS